MKNFRLYNIPTKNTAVHFVILMITLYLITLYFPLNKVDGNYLWQPIAQVILIIAFFYVNSLVLLPIFFKKKSLSKYILWTVIAFTVFYLLSLSFRALQTSATNYNLDWTRPNPLEVVIYNAAEHFWILLIAFIPTTAVCLIYYILLLDKKKRDLVFSSKYVEPFINTLLLIPIFLLFIFNLASTLESRIQVLYLLVLFTGYFYINACFFVKWFLKLKNSGKFIFLNILSFVFIFIGFILIYGLGIIDNMYINLLKMGVIFLVIFSLSYIYGYIKIKLKTDENLFNLKLGAKESELSLLKSQVNPHFLFNTLNSIYATALEENASRTAESTAKMASLIRYMQNDIDKDFIPLENEVRYLKNFISIQKLRSGMPLDIKEEFRNLENQMISPGLLIPFVENAFKYGLNGTVPTHFSFKVICDEKNIYFQCINSYIEGNKNTLTTEGFGIGIKNVKERLKLVYPKKHILQIDDCGKIFKVDLKITTKK